MHPLRSSSKHSIVSLLVRRSRVFRFTSFSKKGTFFRTPWLQRLGLLVFPEDKPHFTTASCFSVAHSAWSFLHTSFLLLPSKKKCQGERLPGPHQHSDGLLRLGGKAHLLRHVPLGSSGSIRGPCLRQVEFSIQEHMGILGRVAQDGCHLAVLPLARRPRVLACHSHRMRSLFEKARLIHDSNALCLPKGLDHKLLQPIACRIGIPGHPVQQALHAIRNALPHRFGHLPTILALRLRQQSSQVCACLFARLAAFKQIGKARVKRVKFLLPLLQFFFCHALPPTQILSPPESTSGT